MCIYIYIYLHACTRLPKYSHAPGVVAPLAYPVLPPWGQLLASTLEVDSILFMKVNKSDMLGSHNERNMQQLFLYNLLWIDPTPMLSSL